MRDQTRRGEARGQKEAVVERLDGVGRWRKTGRGRSGRQDEAERAESSGRRQTNRQIQRQTDRDKIPEAEQTQLLSGPLAASIVIRTSH
ncbi:hypothetical protein E2C01_068122 [Portunus trituberculatus]|uniref:Uncharacterized protein n=1 Tax=Portunus trituberculatus TaxID=210409 RepID=A0A5B7HVG2_PORTR|nr:hypothetical protein [Portunus trituberculatus]